MNTTHFKIYTSMLRSTLLKRLSISLIQRVFCQEACQVPLNHFIRCHVEIDHSLKDLKFGSWRQPHPGQRRTMPVEPPERLVKATKIILQSIDKKHNTLLEEAISFKNYISRRMLPASSAEVRNKGREILGRITDKDDTDPEELSQDDRESLEEKRQNQTLSKLKTVIYHWEPIDYNDHNCMLYLLGCFPRNYAVLCKIFDEIKRDAPTFKPRSFLDFGSGTGSGVWAVNEKFGSSIKESLCIDASGEMNRLNQLLLQDGDPDGSSWMKNIFFKRHLPPSNLIKYDLVISAHSLLDLPTSRERIQVINNLWNKTLDMLVIVENGSLAGHSVVIEARDYILDIAKNDPLKKPVYVIAPCPHDLPCPKSFGSIKRPCSFPVKVHPLNFHKKEEPRLEKYSYIVISKKQYSEEQSKWPRLISPVLKRSKHVVCRMCNANGRLYESIVTAYSCGRPAYKIALTSKWGDMMPVTTVNEMLPDATTEQFTDKDFDENENESDISQDK